MSVFVLSGASLLPFWGKISTIQTCLSLLIVAEGFFHFPLQAEAFGSFSEFPSISFIHFVIYQHASLDFRSLHGTSTPISDILPLN